MGYYQGSSPPLPPTSLTQVCAVSSDGVDIDEETHTKEHTPNPTPDTSTSPPIEENPPMTRQIPDWKMIP
jgi:hypothetical protein